MSATVIEVFNRITNSAMDGEDVYEALLGDYYFKFLEVYHIIKDLPTNKIDSIVCLKLVEDALGICVYVVNDDDKQKMYKKITKKVQSDKYEVNVELTQECIFISVK